MEEKRIKNGVIKLVKGDITDMEVEAFVYNARHDLNIGTGFGTAISLRGGPTVQEECKKLAPIQTTEAVMTGAGTMKAKHIIHAVGPRFQEEKIEEKLKQVTINVLKLADKNGIKQLAFPPMGAGFYGIPLDLCSKVMLGSIKEYLQNGTNIREVIICAFDQREFNPFKAALEKLN